MAKADVFTRTERWAENLRLVNEQLVLVLVQARDLEEARRHSCAPVEDVVVVTDPRRVVTGWNRAAEKTYGWRAEEALGRMRDEVTGAPHNATASEEGVHQWQETQRHRDGRRLLMEGSTYPLVGEDKQVGGYVSVCREIGGAVGKTNGDRPGTDVASVSTELERLKEEFLSTMTHELRTPLNAIIGFTSLVLDQLENAPQMSDQTDYLNQVLVAGNHLLALIEAVLEVSALKSGQVPLASDRVCLADVIDEALESVEAAARNKGLALQAFGDATLTVCTDRTRIRKVIANVLGNAVKFTERGHIDVHFRGVGARVEIIVSDTGIGISQEQRGLIFESFRQVSASRSRTFEGIGLGLHLSRKILDVLGGSIEVKSGMGQGSVFTIRLPAES